MSKILKATHTGQLNIGPITIECAVLQDGTRVLTQSSFLRAIGQSIKPCRAENRFRTDSTFFGLS